MGHRVGIWLQSYLTSHPRFPPLCYSAGSLSNSSLVGLQRPRGSHLNFPETLPGSTGGVQGSQKPVPHILITSALLCQASWDGARPRQLGAFLLARGEQSNCSSALLTGDSASLSEVHHLFVLGLHKNEGNATRHQLKGRRGRVLLGLKEATTPQGN